MMIALPVLAPPMVSTPRAGGRVNSSMLARVPGPGRRRGDATRRSRRRPPSVDPRDRVHDRDGGLPAAGDHVDVRRVEVLAQVDRRDHRRADARPGSGRSRGCRPRRSAARSRGARSAEVASKTRSGSSSVQQPVDALGRGGPGPRPRARARPALSGSMPIIQRGSSHVRAQQLVQQVGADVARPDDARLSPCVMVSPVRTRAVTEPSPANSARKSSPGRTSIARVHEPGRMTSPGLQSAPRRPPPCGPARPPR